MAKGGTFEGDVAKLLSFWWTAEKRDDIFGRSDGSGSRFTSRKKKGKDTANMAGDITFTDSIGEPLIQYCCIECKTGYASKNKVKDADGDIIKIPVYSRKKGEEKKIVGWKDKVELSRWDVLDFVDSMKKKPELQLMWEQCKRDADAVNRKPVLIFRRNLRLPCICIQRDFYVELQDWFGCFEGHEIELHFGWEHLTIMNLKQFFHWAINFRRFLKVKGII